MLTENASDFINDDFQEDVTYSHYNSDTKFYDADETIQGIIDDDYPNQEDHSQRGLRFAVATLIVPAASIPDLHFRDRFTFHGYTWEVSEEGFQKSNVIVTINLVRVIT